MTVGVTVGVLDGVEVGEMVGVRVGVLVGLEVGVMVGVAVRVGVGVTVGVFVAHGSSPRTSFPQPSQSDRSPKYGSVTCAKACAVMRRIATMPRESRNFIPKMRSRANFSHLSRREQSLHVERSIELLCRFEMADDAPRLSLAEC